MKALNLLYKEAKETKKDEQSRESRMALSATGMIPGVSNAVGLIYGIEKGHPVVGTIFGPQGVMGAESKNDNRSRLKDTAIGGALAGAALGAARGGIGNAGAGALGGALSGTIGYGLGRIFGKKHKDKKEQ